jgi:hypothetical protein
LVYEKYQRLAGSPQMKWWAVAIVWSFMIIALVISQKSSDFIYLFSVLSPRNRKDFWCQAYTYFFLQPADASEDYAVS